MNQDVEGMRSALRALGLRPHRVEAQVAIVLCALGGYRLGFPPDMVAILCEGAGRAVARPGERYQNGQTFAVFCLRETRAVERRASAQTRAGHPDGLAADREAFGRFVLTLRRIVLWSNAHELAS